MCYFQIIKANQLILFQHIAKKKKVEENNKKECAFPWPLAKLVAKYTAIPCEVVLCCFDIAIIVGHNKNVVALRRGQREWDMKSCEGLCHIISYII